MRSILVSVLVNLGDVIMMTAALDLLKKNYPDAKLVVLVRPESVDVVANNPVVDEVIVYPYRSGSFFKGLGEVVGRVKKFKPDLFISLDRRQRSAFVAVLAGIKTRVGPDMLFTHSPPKLWTKILFTKTVKMLPSECAGSQVKVFQLVLKRGLGIEGQGMITLPPISPQEDEQARGILADFWGDLMSEADPITGQVALPVIGLCVKTNDPMKTWPLEGYVRLVGRLSKELKAVVFITGSPSDRAYIEELLALLPPKSALNLAGTTSIRQVAALLARSTMYITPDNGVAHLAGSSSLDKLICILVGTPAGMITDSMPRAKFMVFQKSDCADSQENIEQVTAEADEVFKVAASWLNGLAPQL